MTWEIIAVCIMLTITVVLFVTDKVRPDIVSLLILVALGLLGILCLIVYSHYVIIECNPFLPYLFHGKFCEIIIPEKTRLKGIIN